MTEEIAKGRTGWKKTRAKREKAKDKGVKERIAEETSPVKRPQQRFEDTVKDHV